jgi:hypothetical protein
VSLDSVSLGFVSMSLGFVKLDSASLGFVSLDSVSLGFVTGFGSRDSVSLKHYTLYISQMIPHDDMI